MGLPSSAGGIALSVTGISLAVGGGAAFAVAMHAMFAPRSPVLGPVLHRGSASCDGVALTFDDGPHPVWTPRVLEVLREEGVQAGFFVIGAAAREHPELVQQIHAEGHVVGNHSYTHHHLGTLHSRHYWQQELHKTATAVEDAIGLRPALFRPPMGFRSWRMMRAVRAHGDQVVTWSRRAMDGVPTTAENILDRLASQTCSGDVIALHDGIEPRGRRAPEATVEALGPLVSSLRSRGLQLQRLDVLLGVDAYVSASDLEPAAR